MPIITLTTDFGTSDGYVGAMKGVIARGAPEATVIDIAHDVPRHDVAHAAWIVRTACREFPAGTIHVVVIDPGVGTARAAVIVDAGDHLYVGPDNGVFAYLEEQRAWRIERGLPSEPSATFHGRDVFAQVAAHLATGHGPLFFGDRARLAGELPWGPGEGTVVHVDHFGNLISDLPPCEKVTIVGRELRVLRTYEDVAPGELLAYVGSAGTIEVGVRDGRADRLLEAPRGTRVVPVAAGDAYR